jgi:hypothetical protein
MTDLFSKIAFSFAITMCNRNLREFRMEWVQEKSGV